jgi:hypothetical protein
MIDDFQLVGRWAFALFVAVFIILLISLGVVGKSVLGKYQLVGAKPVEGLVSQPGIGAITSGSHLRFGSAFSGLGQEGTNRPHVSDADSVARAATPAVEGFERVNKFGSAHTVGIVNSNASLSEDSLAQASRGL